MVKKDGVGSTRQQTPLGTSRKANLNAELVNEQPLTFTETLALVKTEHRVLIANKALHLGKIIKHLCARRHGLRGTEL